MAMTYTTIEPGDDVFCLACKEITTAGQIDVGYGVTEFWGSVSNHVDLVTCCSSCGCEDIDLPQEEEELEGEEA